MRKLIKKLFNLYEYRPDPDYSELTLENVIAYMKLHKMLTGYDLEEVTMSPINYLEYEKLLEFRTVAFRGFPIICSRKIKVKKGKK